MKLTIQFYVFLGIITPIRNKTSKKGGKMPSIFGICSQIINNKVTTHKTIPLSFSDIYIDNPCKLNANESSEFVTIYQPIETPLIK